jgi:ubiquinone biosynthesis protein
MNFGRRLKLAFEKLGITYIKIGQILSMRYDLLSRRDCEELQQLLDKVNVIPLEMIWTILANEYKKPHTSVFREFCEQPLGSASVSQVHKAVTFDGNVVAVKIKRPNVGEQFLNDIRIMKRLASLAQWFSPTLRNVQARALVDYFESWIQQDLDFDAEVRNMKKCKEQYQFVETVYRKDLGKGVFTLPIESLCTENIVVMDYIDGIPMSRKEELLSNPNYDINKSIKTYVNAAIRNWFRQDRTTYVFQADPHLSNILALPNGDAANIDYGLISELTKKEAQQAKDLIMAVYLQDLNRTLKVACEMTGVSHKKYAPIIKPDIEDYLAKTKDEGLGFWFLEFAKIMIKNKIKFPLYLTTFGRTNLMLDGLVKTYMPEETTLGMFGEELRQAAIRETLLNIVGIDWLRVGYALSEKAKQTPEIVSQFIDNPLAFVTEIVRTVRASV